MTQDIKREISTHHGFEYVVNQAKSIFEEGVLYELVFSRVNIKSREQEKKYHSMLKDIATQCKHLEMMLDDESWKRLCVCQFIKDAKDSDIDRVKDWALKQDVRLIPSLDGGSLVQVGAQTRKFPMYIASAFIEWLHMYGANNDVIWRDPKYQFDEWRE